MLSSEDQVRFQNSKITNDNGDLMVVYHGTPEKNFISEFDESLA
jgi:hypothetical protein